MKVTWGWLADWVDLPSTPRDLAHALAMRGLPVASIEQTASLDPSIVVGRVRSVEPHPNADRLRLCTVDVGTGSKLSIVCGASNVAAGQAVAVARIGSKLPDGTKLRKSKIRGVESEGMICSERELGLSQESHGIWVIADAPQLGMPVQEILGGGDAILDVEITSNRTDCMSVRGLAREIASIQRAKVKPAPALREAGEGALPRVTVESGEDCLRYMARVVRGVRIGPSPEWLVHRLEATGFRSINNVVDVTNYVLRTHGQPIHAFDASKVGGNEIVVRRARGGETLRLLDGREVSLGPHVLVIADRSRPMALAGIMGGLETGVTDATRDVVLESAHFDPRLTKEAARALGLDTDASQRFAQGVDPEGVALALDETARLLAELASGTVARGAADQWPGKRAPRRTRLRASRLTALLGFAVDAETIAQSLAGLDIRQVEPWSGDVATYEAPSYRQDLEIEEDLIEEVARVVGYDHIPSRVTLHAPDPAPESPSLALRARVMERLRGYGFDEALHTALVGAVPDAVLPDEGAAELWEIQNPISRELKHLRPSLLPALLQSAARNLRHGAREVRLAEAGKVFRRSPPPLGTERLLIALVLAGDPDPWKEPAAEGDRYLTVKGVVDGCLEALGIDSRRTDPYHEACWAGGTGARIHSENRTLARIGQVSPMLASAAGLERPAWAAVLEVAALVEAVPGSRQHRPLPKYPASKRDLAIVVDRRVPYAAVEEAIRRGGGALLAEIRLFDVFEGERIGPDKKSLACALEFRSPDRTLNDRDVDEAVRRIVRALSETVGATIRGGDVQVTAEQA